MFIAIVLAVIVLAALILDALPGTSHAVFDAELGLSPGPACSEAADFPGGHVVRIVPARRSHPRRPAPATSVAPSKYVSMNFENNRSK